MSKRRGKSKKERRQARRAEAAAPAATNGAHHAREAHQRAAALVEAGDYVAARKAYEALEPGIVEPALKALVRNDLAVLTAVAGDPLVALALFRDALALDGACEAARANLVLLEGAPQGPSIAQLPAAPVDAPAAGAPIKVAVLSFLFNWPSTGGGIVHTVELAQFLAWAGYEVRHFYSRYDPWEYRPGRNSCIIPQRLP